MPTQVNRAGILISASLLAALLLLSCTVKENREGGAKKVDIQTPVGGMKVSTQADAKDVGLAVYPGARPKPGTSHDESSANVNISTSFFGLKVAVLQYLSDDSPDKIAAFYKQELGKYGAVLECHTSWHGGHVAMHQHKDNDKHLTCDDKGGETLELKVGTEDRQHVVAIKPSGNGAEFALVYVNAHSREDAL